MPAPDSVAIESITEGSDPGEISIEISATTSSNEQYRIYVDEVDEQDNYQAEAYSIKFLDQDFNFTFNYQPQDLTNDIQIHAGPEGDTYWAVDEQSIAQSIGYTEVSIDLTSVSKSSGDVTVSADLSNATDATYSGTVTFTPSGSTLSEKTDSVSFSNSETASVTFTDPPQGSYTIDISVSDSSASAQESFEVTLFADDVTLSNVSFLSENGDIVLTGDLTNNSSTDYEFTMGGVVAGQRGYDEGDSNFTPTPSGTNTIQAGETISVESRWTNVEDGTYTGYNFYASHANSNQIAEVINDGLSVVVSSFKQDVNITNILSTQVSNLQVLASFEVENTGSQSYTVTPAISLQNTNTDTYLPQDPTHTSTDITISPGETVEVNAYHEPVQPSTEPYSVNVGVQGPDGTLIADSAGNVEVNKIDRLNISFQGLSVNNGDVTATVNAQNVTASGVEVVPVFAMQNTTVDPTQSYNFANDPSDSTPSYPITIGSGETQQVEMTLLDVEPGTYDIVQYGLGVPSDQSINTKEPNSFTVSESNPLQDITIQNVQSYSENQDAVVEYTLSNNSSQDISLAVALTVANPDRSYNITDSTFTADPSTNPTVPANGTVDVVTKHTSIEPDTYNNVTIILQYGTNYSKQESANSITVSPPASPNLNYDITPDPQTAPKGTTATMTLEVENTGDAEGTATLAVSNEQTGDVYISDKTVNVPAGETKQEDFSIDTSPLSSGQDYTVQAIKQG